MGFACFVKKEEIFSSFSEFSGFEDLGFVGDVNKHESLTFGAVFEDDNDDEDDTAVAAEEYNGGVLKTI